MNMLRYLRLFALFMKSSLLVELEYRSNFIAQALMGVFWALVTFVSVALFFQHTTALGGWSYEQALVIVGLFTMTEGVTQMFLEPNLQRVVAMVRDGTMDFVLTKPVNSQFIATLRHVKFSGATNFVIGIGLIVYALAQLDYAPSMPQLALFALMFSLGMLMLYSIWLAMSASAFWFVKIDNMQELFRALWDTARFPISAYSGMLRALLTFVLPVAFMTTFPAQALLGSLEPGTLVTAIGMCAALFFLSMQFWRRAIRNYSSASS